MIPLIILARIIEAFRDAQDFNRGSRDMTLEWHLLKIAQYGCWILAGVLYTEHIQLMIALAIAWGAFELSLRGFRKIV